MTPLRGALLASLLFAPGPASADAWTPMAPLPFARAYLAAAPAGGTLYVLGGLSGTSFCPNHEAYNAATDVWWSRSAMRTPRAAFVAGNPLGGTIFAVGGNATPTGQGLQLNEAFNIGLNAWTVQAPMPTGRRYATSACAGGKMYVVGGVISGTVIAVNEAYDPLTNTWIARAPMPTPRFLATATAVGTKIYVIGGITALFGGPNNQNVLLLYLNTVEIYDTVTNAWSTGAPMPTPRGAAGAADPGNGMIYVAGGIDADGSVAVTERYNPGIDAWYARATLGLPASPPAVGRHGLVVVAPPLTGSLFAVGGTWAPLSPPSVRFDGTGLWSASGTEYTANEKYTPDPAILVTALVPAPNPVEVGQSATVYQIVFNAGDNTATAFAVAMEVVTGSAAVTPPAGPVAATGYVGGLRPGETQTFTWSVTAVDAGLIVFSGTASGTDEVSAAPVSASATNWEGLPLVTAFSAVLTSAVTLAPLPLSPGGQLRVTLTVTNTGGGTSYLTSGLLTTWQGAGLLSLVAGPVPSGTVMIGPLSSTLFTWTFSVTGAGYALFTASATGEDELFGAVTTGATRSTGPAAPTGLAVTQGDTRAFLTWNANPAFEQISAYQVFRSLLPGVPGSPVGTVAGPGFTDAGLANGVTYFYTVRAINGDATGPPSAEVSVVPLVLPGSPGDVRIVPSGIHRLAIDPARGERAQILLNVPAGAGTVRVVVYTLLAEEVREVYHGPAAPGPLILAWDGRNAKGRLVASGGYLLIVKFPDGRRVTRKLAVLK